MVFHTPAPRPDDTPARLERLDLTVEDLVIPVRAGVEARRTTTRHHPKAFSGWVDYAERVAALRDGLVSRGWTAEEREGVCLVVHPERRLAIMTALGTSGTGTAEPVTTVRRRGKVTEQIVSVNAQLAFDLVLQEVPHPSRFDMPVYALLVHREEDEIRSELSLAARIDDDGYIDRWKDRIPLPVIRLNEVLGDGDGGNDEPPFDPDFDVPEL